MAEFVVKAFDTDKKAKKGHIIEAISDFKTEVRWAEMLFRGTHGLDISFNPTIYNKYFTRVKVITMFRKPIRQIIANPEQSIRDCETGKYFRYVDVVKVKLLTPLQSEAVDDMASFDVTIKHPSGRKITECYPFGTMDIKRNLMIHIPESEFYDMLEIEKYKEKKLKDNEVKFKYKIDYDKKKSNLKLNKTVLEIKGDPEVTQEYKNFLNQNYEDNEVLLDILHDENKLLPNMFLSVGKDVIELESDYD